VKTRFVNSHRYHKFKLNLIVNSHQAINIKESYTLCSQKTLIFVLLTPSKINEWFYMRSNVTSNKKLSCRRETARRFVSLNILLIHSSSFEMTLLS